MELIERAQPFSRLTSAHHPIIVHINYGISAVTLTDDINLDKFFSYIF